MCADISGFTALTEFLLHARGARVGAEALIDYTNNVYTLLIDAAEHHGGIVMDFAGDAILCWFDGDDDAIMRSLAAGLAMQDCAPRCREFSPSGWEGVLSLKVTIAAGPARRLVVGNPATQFLDVLMGSAIDRLAALAPFARDGAVIVDLASLGPCASRVHFASDAPDLVTGLAQTAATQALRHLPDLAPALLMPWIAAPLRARMAGSELGFLSEIRRVAAVFLGFDSDPHTIAADAAASFSGLVAHAQQVAAGFGGLLLQVSFGDKGSYLYLVFGAPATHGDDVVSALDAALALMQPHAATAPFRNVRAGVCSGYARTGIYGAPRRQSYGVMGNAVNIAARLMQKASPGQILVPLALLSGTGQPFASTALGPVSLKGIGQSIEVAAVDSHASRRSKRPGPKDGVTLIGRGAELAELEALLDGLGEGSGGAALIEAEAGMGKSALLRAMAAAARGRSVNVLTSEASRQESSTLYAVWQRVLAALLGMPQQPAQLVEAIAAIDPALVPMAPLVAQIMHMQIAPTPETVALTGDVRAQTIREVLALLLVACARRHPLLVILEDAHWFDSASSALLRCLLGLRAPLVLLISARPSAEAPELTALRAHPALACRTLDPLPAPALLAIVCARIGARAIAGDAAALVLDKAGGNPFYAEELALALVGLGTLAVGADGMCRAVDGVRAGAGELPDSVEGVVTARLDRLAPAQQTLIKLASVVGRSFDVPLVAELARDPGGTAALVERLDQLTRLDVLERRDGDGLPTYAFRHAITHDVAYHMMLLTQRRKMHQAVALWYEELHGTSPAAVLPVLAAHWAQVADSAEAEPATLVRAGERLHQAAMQAQQANAHGEAARHLERALPLVLRQAHSPGRDHHEMALQALLGYCLSTQRGFGDPGVEQAYRRGFALAQSATPSPSPSLAFTLYGLFSFYASRAEYGPARQLAEQLCALGERLGDRIACAFGHHSAAIAAVLGGDSAAALAHLQASDELGRDMAPDAFFGFGQELPTFNGAWAALAHAASGDMAQAYASFERALASGAGSPHGRAFVLCFAMVPVWDGDLDATLACCDQLDQLAGRYGFTLYACAAQIYRGWALALRDGDADGVVMIAAALPLLRAVRLHSFLPMFLGLYARACVALGDQEGAATALAEARALTGSAGGGFHDAALAVLDTSLHSRSHA